MAVLREFSTLLWKNWILQKRKLCVTAFEIILPLLFWGLLLVIRGLIFPERWNPGVGDQNPGLIDGPPPFGVDGVLRGYARDRSHRLLYSPNTTATQAVVQHIVKMNSKQKVTVVGVAFRNEEDMLQAYQESSVSLPIVAGIVFDETFAEMNSVSQQVTIRIRLPSYGRYSRSNRPNTALTYGRLGSRGGPCTSYSYVSDNSREFLRLQYGLMGAIIELQAPPVNMSDDVNISLHQMACQERRHDRFFYSLAFEISVPILVVMCYLIFAVQITQIIVSEKQKKLTMWLQMLGVRERNQWGAWFVKWLIQLTVLNIILTVLVAVDMPRQPVVGKSDASLFFLLMVFYSVATITFCFMISTLFQKATPGAVACAVLFLLTYMPYVGVQLVHERMSIHEILAASLLHNVALGVGCQAITNYEIVDKGAQWSNFYRPAASDQDLSLLLAMVMLVIDSALYMLVTWYVYGVHPGRHGVPRPWYFPFTRDYWRGPHGDKRVSNTSAWDGNIGISSEFGELFQADPTDKTLGIAIRGLRKIFGSGESRKVAVADVVLNVYRGQITALLGHNGAGKTTTISMLTGFLPPTSGTATVDGQDIQQDSNKVAQTVGLCPQDDILFDSLTVREHLVFFAKLRDEQPEFIDENVYRVIHDVGLGASANTQAGRLSGGQRRTLSVAIALMTSSQIVILDEPTSGMDPASRRQLWAALKRYKENKAILFTTHNMEEADSLSDRVAIMSEGVIKCSGSPLFLKTNFGVGYHLRVAKAPRCDVLSIKNIVTEHVPEAKESYNLASALMMTLPKECSPNFHKLFEDLEGAKEKLGVDNFSVTFTTMEDVFLRFDRSRSEGADLFHQIGNSVREDFLHTDDRTSSQTDIAELSGVDLGRYLDFNEELSISTGLTLVMQQFCAGVYKKYLHSRRNPFLLAVQILATVILVSLGFSVSTTDLPDEPPLELDTKVFQDNEVPYAYGPEGPEAEKLISSFLSTLQGSDSVAKKVDNIDLYGYLSQQARDTDFATFSRKFVIGESFNLTSVLLDIRGYYNHEAYHSSAISLSTIMNTLLKYYVHPQAGLKIINHPFPNLRTKDDDAGSIYDPISSIVISFSLGLLSSTFIVLILKERNSRAKHVQMVSGMRPWIYWLSTFVWDMVNMLIPITCLLVVMAAYRTVYVDGGLLGYVFLVLLLYGWATLPFTYLWSFIFKTQTCGFITMLVLNILSGPVLLVFVVVALSFGSITFHDGMSYGFGAFLPNVAVGRSLAFLVVNYKNDLACQEKGNCRETSPYLSWTRYGLSGFLLIMFLQGVVYFLLVLAAEYKMSRKNQKSVAAPESLILEDSDVFNERTRIKSDSSGNSDSLILQNLSRRYGKKIVAVDNLCLGVSRDECFGLLGVNGAGKSATFKILSGEDRKYSGEAFVNGNPVSTGLRKAYGTIGYCPQKDTLMHLMTGRETLTFYARLKGIHPKRIKAVVDQLLATLFLEDDADRLTDIYSIGNKRKLSAAIALLGDPVLLLLDEPTAGVDPVAKRRLWNVLTDVRASGRTIVLTSHSMEECDALCTRMAIMVNGRFMCLGSPQHLKEKFGQGYTLTVRVEIPNAAQTSSIVDTLVSPALELRDTTQWTRIQAVKEFISTAFPDHKLVPSADDTVKCNLPASGLLLSRVFQTVEEVKERLSIADYSVSQTSLEDVFLYLASYQMNPISVC